MFPLCGCCGLLRHASFSPYKHQHWKYLPIVVLALILNDCPSTGGLGVMVMELIFPWSDGFAANTDRNQITEKHSHYLKS